MGGQQSQAQLAGAAGVKGRQVAPALLGLIEQHVEFGRFGGRFAHQVHQAGNGVAAVQGRGRALDDFDLPQIQGRNLHQAQALRKAAIEREAVAQQLRVAPVEALDAEGHAAGIGGGELRLDAAGLGKQHGDVGRFHAAFFGQLFRPQHLNADGHVLDARAGAGGFDHHALQFEAAGFELHQGGRVAGLGQGEGDGACSIADAGKLHLLGAGGHVGQRGAAVGVGGRANAQGRNGHGHAGQGGFSALIAHQHAQRALGHGDVGAAQEQRQDKNYSHGKGRTRGVR